MSLRNHLTVLAVAATLAVAGCNLQVHPRNEGSTGGKGVNLLIGIDSGTPTLQRNFNPYSTTKRSGINFMYEPLEVVNGLNGRETPFLATGHTQPSASSVVFTIRTAVKWSDGVPFTPDDVVFTFNLLKKYPALDINGIWQYLKKVSADGNKVRLDFKRPDAPSVQRAEITLIVPKHIWSKLKNPVTATNANPVVTGPFTLDRFNPNQYVLKRNPTYWQASKVVPDTLTFPASNTQLELVKNGYDWAYAFIPDVKKTWVGAKPAANKFWFPAGGIITMFPNLAKAPFNNLNFRKGVSFALDRATIADHAETGYVTQASQAGVLIPGQQGLLDPSIPNKGFIKQNTATALSYFQKAGYTKRGNRLVDSRGKQVSLTITTPAGYTDWLRGAQTVQRQLGQIGIKVGLRTPQPPAATQATQRGDFQLSISAFSGSGIPHQDFSQLLDSRLSAPIGKQAYADFERFKDPAVNATLDKLRSTVDKKAQLPILHQVQRTVYDQVPAFTLFYGGLWSLYSTNKVTGWPDAADPYSAPRPYLSDALSVMTSLKPANKA